MNSHSYLKFGDEIQLLSADNPTTFLCGRSMVEEDMYTLDCPYIALNSLLYENTNELLFTVHPKLSYEAFKERSKIKLTDPKTKKTDLLHKRAQDERENNQKRVFSEKGASVKVGSEVQFYHAPSRSYLRATREKNSKGNNALYNLKLSRKGGSGFVFKILPYYSFKKEGEDLFYTDKFYLENPKLQAYIVFKQLPKITKPQEKTIRIPHAIASQMGIQDALPDGKNADGKVDPGNNVALIGDAKQERRIEIQPLMEFSKAFTQYEAGLKQGGDLSNPFYFNVVHPAISNNNPKWLLWGDYIRIKYQRKNEKATGFLFSDPTIIGCSPEVYLRYIKGGSQNEKESFQSIFQLIPEEESQLGQPIRFDQNDKITLQLRHLLTGRYLRITNGTGIGMLSLTLDEFLALNSPEAYKIAANQNANSPLITHTAQYFTKSMRDPRATPPGSSKHNLAQARFLNLDRAGSVRSRRLGDRNLSKEAFTPGQKPKIDLSHQQTENFKDLQKDFKQEAEEVEVDQNNPFINFCAQTKVVIKNAASEGDDYLSTSSCFSINSIDTGYTLCISSGSSEDQSTSPYWERNVYPQKFHISFHQTNPLDKTDFPTHNDENNEDFFFFQMVPKDEISEFMTVTSKLYPIVVIAEKGDSPSEQIKRAIDSLQRLERWLSNSNQPELLIGQESTLTIAVKQKMMREIGVIDLIINLIKGYYTQGLLKGELNTPTDYKNVNGAAIKLLRSIIKKNRVNSIYTSQWNAFFMDMILSDMVLKDLGIDHLLSELFSETDASITAISDAKTLPEVVKSLRFDYYMNDIKALNISIALCLYNPKRSRKDQDQINEIILENPIARNQIFRKMYIQTESASVILEISPTGHHTIDSNLETKNKKLFDYTLNIIRLATELAKGKPEIVAKYLGEFFQPEVCVTVFANRKLNPIFRSVFVDLYLHMYIVPECRLVQTLEFPNKIKFLHGIKMDDTLRDHFSSIQKDVIEKVISVGDFNLKAFVKDYLEDVHLMSKEEHILTKSILEVLQLMLTKGFYEKDEIKKLKVSLYNFLKYGLASIHIDSSKNEVLGQESTVEVQAKESGEESGLIQRKSIVGASNEGESKGGEQNEKENNGSHNNSFEQDKYFKSGDENSEMISWMLEVLKALIFIENYEMDSKIVDFIGNERNSKFFNDRMLFKNELPKNSTAESLIIKLKKEKESHIKTYVGDSFVLQHYNNTLLLIELLLLKDLRLTCQIVHLLYLNFTQHETFLKALNKTEVVDIDNIELYNNCIRVYDDLNTCYCNLLIEKSPGNDAQYSNNLISNDMFGDDVSPATEQYIKVNDTLKRLLNDLLVTEVNPDEIGRYYHVYDQSFVDLSNIKLTQTLLRNLEFIPLCEKLLVGLKEGYVRSNALKTSITEYFLQFFLYYCINNTANQEHLANSPTFISSLFEIQIPEVYPLVLYLVSEIFKDNYPMLMNLPKQESDVIKRLLRKFFIDYKNNQYKNMIYAIRIFPIFFQIQDNYLLQNQAYLSGQFRNSMIERNANQRVININRKLFDELKEFLHTKTVEKCVIEKDNPDIAGPPSVKVPIEISFAIHLLKTFAGMAAGNSVDNGSGSSSNAAVALNNKQLLTIVQIKELLTLCDDWYNLRLALVSFFNYTYVANKKLEENEVSELFEVVKYTLMKELNEYIRFLKNRELYHRPANQQFVEDFSMLFTVSTELCFSSDIDTCYDQYAVYGLLESFRFYVARLKSIHQEQDSYFLEDYMTALKDLKDAWMSGAQQKKFSMFKGGIKALNKMIDPLREPSEPDLLEYSSDLDVSTRNDFRKLNPDTVKKEILRLTNLVQKSPRAEVISLRKPETILIDQRNQEAQINSWRRQLAIDTSTIEREYNAELEILVKFLLELKIENTEKFKKIIGGFMELLSDNSMSQKIKNQTLKVLRKLSNFRMEQNLYLGIQDDLFELEFVRFLCEVIVEAVDDDNRHDFILGMIDFLDEASERIQIEFLENLKKDENNEFLIVLRQFLVRNFEDFREHEKNYREQSSDLKKNAREVAFEKMNATMNALELIRLPCENHFTEMQNYLREQTQQGSTSKRTINFIIVIAEIFNKYVKSINETNYELGIKIFETIIEMLQGPCQENQLAICNTKFLENVQDLMVEIKDRSDQMKDGAAAKTQDSEVWIIEINQKIITFLQAMLEGSNNEIIVKKISAHVDPQIFMERMIKIYNKYYKISKKSSKRLIEKGSDDKKNIQSIMVHSEKSSYDLDAKEAKQLSVEERANEFLKEGAEIYLIIQLLQSMSPAIQDQISVFKEKKEGKSWQALKAEKYYETHTGVIEIINEKDQLQKIYFPLMKKARFLSNRTKEQFEDTVSRDSHNEKLFGMLNNMKAFEYEMDLFLNCRRRGVRFSLTMFSYLRYLNLILAVATNIVILASSVEADLSLVDNAGDLSPSDDAVYILGIIQTGLSLFIILLWMTFRLPLDLKKTTKKLEESINESSSSKEKRKGGVADFTRNLIYYYKLIAELLFGTEILYLSIYTILAFLGLFISKVFFTFLLLDLIDRSIILNNVIKSITLNYKQLVMTAVLGILLLYIWAVIGFFFLSESYTFVNPPDMSNLPPNVSPSTQSSGCNSIWQCFLTLLDNGFRAGGGIGDAIETPAYLSANSDYAKRFFYDVLFFILITVILLNIIFGIIIDTFAELRENKKKKDEDMKNKCFICDIDRDEFEKAGVSFDNHVKYEHNLWNYVYFIVYLRSKNTLDYNGTESYIHKKYEKKELSWFPMKRALGLSKKREQEEDKVINMVNRKLEEFERKLQSQFQITMK